MELPRHFSPSSIAFMTIRPSFQSRNGPNGQDFFFFLNLRSDTKPERPPPGRRGHISTVLNTYVTRVGELSVIALEVLPIPGCAPHP